MAIKKSTNLPKNKIPLSRQHQPDPSFIPLSLKASKKKANQEKPVEEKTENASDYNSDAGEKIAQEFGYASSATGYDSSDDEVVSVADSLPEIRKQISQKIKEKINEQESNSEESGVIYLGRIPHGFYEAQMQSYFSQFGEILNLRLSRNKKTGKSKHYGFIEFESKEVAEIVAETMNNYLMFGHVLHCKLIPKEKVHPELFVGANEVFRPLNYRKRARSEHNRIRTKEEEEKRIEKLRKKKSMKMEKLKELQIEV
ncbi:Nucleotide-binding, alpha-beta plait domain-containing protein [Rozella allomycis CSF55]|uniref:Nucleotide-binding, alpha-beta plait domain-containing protein n=1 Tax=Rozella allomycis (strain CSF55) TaxID=988480 RepID=A0A075AWA8_ROZAC|nr:Nucleotide-binding, alpha-beta plait domain-containing protein [Rozella allomycis CSF55]|eukprot:EPZ34447.1 Nucleotide-binding, alpha-beta plait domain-containing protein [Rozella allomycis CSF55]